MKPMLKYLPLLAALLVALPCLAQSIDPEEIDPYTFEITGNSQTGTYATQAYTAYNAGEYEKAAKYYLAHLVDKPDDAVSWYNLSCCFGLLNQPDLAAKYLMRAFKAGYTDLNHIVADTDYDQVKADGSFQATLDSLQTFSARKQELEGETRFLAAKGLMPYYLHLPKDYDPARPYPLLIALHGYGDVARKFSRIWSLLENDEVILAVPEAQYPFTEGEIGFSWSPELDFESPLQAKTFQYLTQYVADLQRELSTEYNIGATWLMGFSQGAYLGYMLTLKNPWMFEGLIACGGGLIEEAFDDLDYKAGRELKIIISHGKQDMVVPFAQALQARKVLEDKGFKNIHFQEFEGGHQISAKALEQFRVWIKD